MSARQWAHPARHRPALRGFAVLATALGLGAALVACGEASPQAPDSTPSTAAPQRSPQPSERPSGTRSPVGAGTCFDVIEMYTGLVVLPLSTGDVESATPQPGQEGSELTRARESVKSQRDRAPQAVRPAFDEAVRLLDRVGTTLQPAEAAQLQRALQPVQDWISAQCSAAPPTRSVTP